MPYRKRVTKGHRIDVESTTSADLYVAPTIEDIAAGRLSQEDYNGPDESVVQRATCSCGWTTGPAWKPHTMVTVAVTMHGGAS